MSMSGRERALHNLKRVVESPKAFSNWPKVLVDMSLGHFGRGPESLSFATRTGLRIDCPNVPGARVPVYEIFAEDCYRFDWILGSLKDRPIRVIDIGGHVGTFACRLAQVHPKATIEAYEPSPTTARYLRKNVEQNALADRITVSELALAAETGFAELDDNGGGSGLNGLVSTGRGSSATSTKVQTIAFDEVVAQPGAPIDFMKIDCEGGEYDLIYGSSPSSWDSVQRVVIEYHPVPGQTWSKLRDWFAGVGLNVVAHKPENAQLGSAWLSREPLAAFGTS
ncbi:MAG: FkbM family methyltransferase [Jatrophihabitantaceae bacterium]